MKKHALALIALAAISWTVSLTAHDTMYFIGEIMDSQCAAMGSHDQRMTSIHAKDAKDCTLQCVKNGATFVLFDPMTKMVYQLDNQKKPKSFAGAKVMISGTLDADNKTIHVKGIDPAPTGRHYTDW
jgi:hypothetical protein